ncbi:MmgE/PrpD family protein [Defluviimonas salinarum]|uniref:MmgE/PrpD family protein n=1 Tax=Defluviimonas salinarum TaxID=2992147 RepID=A0ABT3JAX3_9RHOB|nr:MmgE/PrpD family protein [Defluviimonas salinarum]MCW3784585.1 MmgE/PrpD family protein [Defluviimonas salinarum]
MPFDAARRRAFADFALRTRYDDIPLRTRERVKDYCLDLIGVSAAAAQIEAARIGREMAVRQMSAGADDARARILFDGRCASLVGAAYAGATQIDSLDAHDGYSAAKGHAGCGLLPSLLAFAERKGELTGEDFLTSLVVGYEIACRAGLALHGTVSDYHTSGAWVSLAVAALGVRLLNPHPDILRHAIGIAEYHGPRSQMMREIGNPTMLHDGSGWGAMVGVSAAELALMGYSGAPAVTVEGDDASDYWEDLGHTWLTDRQNIKLYPICRWAHAPVKAALDLRAAHHLQASDIASIHVESFHEATRLARGIPETTAVAQYSLDYPVAAALVCGALGAHEVSGKTFHDPEIARLVSVTTVAECPHCNANFPADRLGRTILTTFDGRTCDSGIVRAPGEHSNPILRDGIVEKFHTFTAPVLSAERRASIEHAVFSLGNRPDALSALQQALYGPIVYSGVAHHSH